MNTLECGPMPNVMVALPNIGGALCYAAHFRPTSEIRTKATPCVEVWQTSNLLRLRLGEEKKERRRKKEETTGQKYNGPPYSIGRP